LYLRNNQLSGQFFYFSGWPVPEVPSNFVGELPLAIIKMKTRGVYVKLSDNTGFTLPTNMNELGKIQDLDLSD
jgi:hypothetical protein